MIDSDKVIAFFLEGKSIKWIANYFNVDVDLIESIIRDEVSYD